MTIFKRHLIDKAREISENIALVNANSAFGIIRREIALTVEQLDSLKIKYKEQLQSLLRAECLAATDLKQLENQIPKNAFRHFPEKEKYNDRFFNIEKERRSLSMKFEEKIRTLEDKLLDLVNQYEELNA